MKKFYILSVFLSVALSLCAIIGLNAASDIGTVTDSKNFLYSKQNNSIAINEYVGGYLNVIIPDTIEGYPVTEISSNAFRNCAAITDITMPDSIISIGSYAFDGCNSLKKVKMSSAIEKIDMYVFKNCNSLEEVVIPDKVSQIEYKAFSGCISLKSVSLPASLSRISCNAFDGCINLKNITVNKSSGCFDGVLSKVDATDDGNMLFRCAKCGNELLYRLPEQDRSKAVITIGTVTALPGDRIKVPVFISGNPGICAAHFYNFNYDKDVLLLDNVICGNDALYRSEYIRSYVTVSKTSQEVFDDGILFIMCFTVKQDAKDGIYDINMNYEASNKKEESIDFYIKYGSICVQSQNETDTNTEPVIDKPKPIETDPVTDKPIDTEPDTKPDEYLIGDINGDGKVNSKDLTRLMKIIAGVSGEAAENVDINGDGKVNSKDLTRLMKMIAGDTAA